MKAIQVDLHTSAAAVTSSVASFQVGAPGQLSALDILQGVQRRQTSSQPAIQPDRQADQRDPGTTSSTAAVADSTRTFPSPALQIAIGLAALLWGPASDRFGSKPVLVLATVMFALSNLPLIFAPDIGILLAFRTLQGTAVAAYVAAGPAMLADICSPANRDTLFGVCSVAALLGPVLGRPLAVGCRRWVECTCSAGLLTCCLSGWLHALFDQHLHTQPHSTDTLLCEPNSLPPGFLCCGLLQTFGWRSMFVLLAGLSALVILPLLLWCVPETLQHKVMQRLSHQEPAAALKVAEAATILEQVCVQACVST